MTEDELRELLRELRDEPVPADSLVRVRSRVAMRTAARRLGFYWRIAALLVASACIVVAVVFLRPKAPVVKPAPPVVAVTPKPAPVESPAPTPPRKRARAAVKTPPPEEDVVIRIETPDPDVVILLIGD